jgi:MFS family permease
VTEPPTRWKAAAVALLLGVIAALSIGKLPPALPALRAEFGLSLAETGRLVSVFNTLGMVASIFMGLLTPRIGAWRLCMLGLGLLAGGGLLGAVASGQGLLLAARFAEGTGFLAVVVAAPTLLNHATAPADRARAFSLWGSYMPTGTALGMLLAPLLLASSGWRVLWVVVALCTVLAMGLLLARRADYGSAAAAPAPQAAPSWRAAAGPLTAAGPWCIALCFACYVFNYYAIMVWLPTFMVGERQMALATASLLTAVVVAANIPGNWLAGALLQRGVSRGANVCAAGVLTLLTCSAIFSPALPDGLRYAACVLFSFSVGVLPGSVMSASQTHARSPAQVATVQGMIMQGSNLGQFVSPLLVAAVVVQAPLGAPDWSRMLGLLLASGVLIVAGGLWLRTIERHTVQRHGAGAAG